MSPSISVIMPAYNAERTIELALRSIRMQTIADQIEILVIDGGSTDATREIARQYGAVILENPHRLRNRKADWHPTGKGRYIIEQDTDEELLFPDQLEKRLSLLRAYPEVHLVVVDEQAPGRLGGVATRYVCVAATPLPSLSTPARMACWTLSAAILRNNKAISVCSNSHLAT